MKVKAGFTDDEGVDERKRVWPAVGGRRGGARYLRVAALLGIISSFVVARELSSNPARSASWWGSLGVRDLAGRDINPDVRWFVVVFLGQDCPVSNAAIPVLNKLAADFKDKGFAFVGAYSDPTVDVSVLRAHAVEYSVSFLTADDRNHRLVNSAQATYTPEAVVFSAAGTKLYDGRIDDRVGALGVARPSVARQDLREVLLALCAGSPGPFPGTPGYGCALTEAVRP